MYDWIKGGWIFIGNVKFSNVSIIILSWNTAKTTVECVNSILHLKYPNYDLIVVDNNSTDGTLDNLKDFCQTNLDSMVELSENEIFQNKIPWSDGESKNPRFYLIKNRANYGFARGNNIGIRFALNSLHPDFILLLNSDTVVEKQFLNILIEFALNNEKIASVQPLILNANGDFVDSLGQELLLWGARDKGNGQRFQKISKKAMEIFGPCAAAALYRSEALRKMGLLDEDFFIIFEDLDLSWRMQLAGYRSVLIPNSIVYHRRGISGSTTNSREKFFQQSIKTYHTNKNWINIVIRYYPIKYIFLVILKKPIPFFRTIFLSIFYALQKKQGSTFLKLFKKSLLIRKKNSKNRLLTRIQLQWIKKAFQ